MRVTTCLENLAMSGNLTAVSEMSGILLKVGGYVPRYHVDPRVFTYTCPGLLLTLCLAMLAMYGAQCCGHTCHHELWPMTSIVVRLARTMNSSLTSLTLPRVHTLNEKSAFRQRESNSVDRLTLFWIKFVNWGCLVRGLFNQLSAVVAVHGSTSDVQSREVQSRYVHSLDVLSSQLSSGLQSSVVADVRRYLIFSRCCAYLKRPIIRRVRLPTLTAWRSGVAAALAYHSDVRFYSHAC